MEEFYCKKLRKKVDAEGDCFNCYPEDTNLNRKLDPEICQFFNKVGAEKLSDLKRRYKKDPRFFQLVNHINTLCLKNTIMFDELEDAILVMKINYLKE